MMQNAHPITILERLLKEASADDAEHLLMVSQDFWDVDEQKQIEQISQQFTSEFEKVCMQVSESWGVPNFKGEWDDAQFPDWCDAIRLAYWRRGNVIAYVAFRHDDKELPMIVVLGAHPLKQ